MLMNGFMYICNILIQSVSKVSYFADIITFQFNFKDTHYLKNIHLQVLTKRYGINKYKYISYIDV